MKVGLDIGSTTIKCVVLNEENNIIFSLYERHYSHIVEKAAELLEKLDREFIKGQKVALAFSGSAGMGIAQSCNVSFVQEVFATRVAAQEKAPNADVIIELGGEDAKILFMTGGTEVRMNGSCAGGTGAFIDQMATLLKMTPGEMNTAAEKAQKIYTIASRCGVFAKSDIQPLINQGASPQDISKSIFYAVVNQTIAGLAQGRKISGNVLYLGGPLSFLPQLRAAFDHVLKTKGICPKDSLYFVALGAALYGDKEMYLQDAVKAVNSYRDTAVYNYTEPLFAGETEYQEFCQRHEKAAVPRKSLQETTGKVHIGIDAGSTTVKVAVIDQNSNLLYTDYQSNSGNPIPVIRKFLIDIYKLKPDTEIASVTATGYGEEISKIAFGADFGVVETVAHFTAAKHFMPNVDFVIDIGGQDMKCFKIEKGAISDIFLNEACSSGCGSFLQTFAQALGYEVSDFAKLGIFAKKPVELGSRCTVFMNSSVKQAQKDGASVENISAGLSNSVVKNALYKVIRVGNADELGKNIVVQGGTFYNEAVLRAFEKEMGVNVIRPDIAGLMGAYGAALYGKAQNSEKSSVLTLGQLEGFTQDIKTAPCGLCGNNCQLTISTFAQGQKFISGNRCDRPVTKRKKENPLNLYEYIREKLESYTDTHTGTRGTIALPLALNMYELLPFWHTFFTKLGFDVIHSGFSDRKLYLMGQATIPSDTVCFPAKLVHGHIEKLMLQKPKAIFYPCMTYNIDEGLGDNHYNCPVVAYYPEVIGANSPQNENTQFIYDYIGIHRRKDFPVKIAEILAKYFDGITLKEVKNASDAAYMEYANYLAYIRAKGMDIINFARNQGKHIIVLAGRPYHVDPEINHGIDQLICSYGVAVVTEESVSALVPKFATGVLNQWTYHSRLYAAAKYIEDKPDMDLVQLVSFGCGVDAITTDETHEILDRANKLYTQIKIDEITNLGAVNIRLRSLLAAIEEKKGGKIQWETE